MEVDKGLNELQPSSQNGGRASPPALVSPQPQFMQHRPPPTGIMLPQHMRSSPSPPLQSGGGSGGPGSPFLVGGGGGYMSPPHLPQHHPMHHPQHHLPMHHPVMAFHPHPHSQSPRPLPLYTASSPSPVATAASTGGGSGPQTLEALLKQQLGLTSSPSSSVEETTTGYRGVPPPEQPSTDGNSSFSSSSFSSSNNHNDSENKDTPTPLTSNTTETAATATAASTSPPSSIGSSTPGTPSTMEAKTPSSRKKRSTAPEPGLRLQGAVVDYASVRPKQLPQLQATQPITLYNPAQTYHLGTLIAVTQDYICYAIKGHMIRAIHIFTGETVLLRGHTQRVTDLRAFHRGNLLASVGKDGLIFVWKILQRKAETEGSKVSDQVATIIDKEIVLKIEHEEGSEKQHQRVVWHPAHSNILATSASDGNVYIWDIRKLLENAENNVVVHNASIPGVIVAPVASKINDLCFSPDGEKLAIASEDGNVRIFDLETQAFVQTWNAHGGEPVHAVRWTSGPPVMASSSVAGEAFVTGGKANREIVVWNTDTWTRRQTIELEHSASDSKEASSPGQTLYFNHVAFDPSSTFLFVARAADSSVIVVHMARAAATTNEGMRGDTADTIPSNSSLEDTTTASVASPLPTGLSPDAGCCYFDYLSELNVGQPILSFTATNQSLPTASPSPQEPSASSSSPQKLETKLYCMQAKAIQMYDLTTRIPQLAGDAAASPMKRSKSSKRSSSRTRSLSKLSLSGKRKLASRASPVEPEAPPSEESGKTPDVQQEENEGASSEQEKKLQEGAAPEVATQQQAQPPAADQTTTLDNEKQPQLPPQPDEEKEHAKGECSSSTVDGVAETIGPKEKSEEIAATSTAEEQPESPSAVESHKNEKSPTAPKADEVSTGQSSAASVPPPRSSEALGDTQEQSSLTEVSEPTTEMTSKKSPSFSILPESTKEEPSQANNKAGPDTTHATPPPTPMSPQQRPKQAEKPTTPTTGNNKKGANKNRRKESQVKQGPGVLPAANAGASSNSSSSVPSSANTSSSVPASSPASGTPAAGQTVSILSRSNKRSQRSSNNVGLPEVNSSVPTASSIPVAAEASGTDQLALSRLLTELQGMRNDMKAMEANTALRMEQTLQRQIEAQFARLEKKNEEREKQARDRQQRLFAAISQNINATVTQTVEKAVQKEVQNLVIPTLQRSLRSMETSLSKTVHEGILKPLLTELEPKLNSVATSLTDNLAQALSKRDQEGVSSSTNAVQLAPVPSALSLAATNQLAASLQQPVQEAFSSYFKDILVPAFENSCRAMFVQIDASIKNGLKESFRSLEARGAPSAAGGTGGSGVELTAEYGLMMQQMRTAVQTLVDISSGLNRSIVETQNQLLLHYASSMEALQQQAAGMLPRQGGVAQAEKKEDVTTTLNRLLNQSRYEEAFNLVLSQSNVDLLTWLCSQVDPQTVFAKTPAMDQLVLLSLLQQLGFALDQDSQLKLRWLTEIALQVDPTNPTTTTLASPILNTLLQNLEQVLLPQLSASRDRTTMHSFKVLTHIVNSLLQECDKETSSSAAVASFSAPNTISSSATALPSSAASSSAPPSTTPAKHQTSSSTKAKSKRS